VAAKRQERRTEMESRECVFALKPSIVVPRGWKTQCSPRPAQRRVGFGMERSLALVALLTGILLLAACGDASTTCVNSTGAAAKYLRVQVQIYTSVEAFPKVKK
jgi:hypothetical protein